MNTGEVLNLIKQMIKAGTQRIGFFGGEALLRKDFSQIVDFCTDNGIYITLVSNGYLVPENIGIIKKLNCLILSFDGPKEIHDANRETGSYNKVIKAIRIAEKHVPLITHTTLTKYSIDYIDGILEIAKKYGFYTTYSPVFYKSGMMVSNQQFKAAVNKLMKMKKKGYPILISDTLLNYWLNWENISVPYKLTKESSDPKCWAGKLFCEINSDGSISNCDSTFGLVKRNVLSEGFERAFQSLYEVKCKACIKTWAAEYNFMYSLNFNVISNWVRFVRKT
jgi:MoaA/NifB/PqqE/SkfB family radical SAM enzyme